MDQSLVPTPNARKKTCRLLIICAGILLAGCRSTGQGSEGADFDYQGPEGADYTWDALKASLRAPNNPLTARMWLRCVVLESGTVALKEGLHDWDEVEQLRDRLGDKVRVKNACSLEGLKDGTVEVGYYLTPVSPEAGPKALHGLRLQARDVRISGQELSCRATLAFGRHQADTAWHDGRRGFAVAPITPTFERNVEVRMRSNQVQVVNLGFAPHPKYVALIEIIDAPIPAPPAPSR